MTETASNHRIVVPRDEDIPASGPTRDQFLMLVYAVVDLAAHVGRRVTDGELKDVWCDEDE